MWVEYPDVEPLCKKIGAAPTGTKGADGSPLYTLPTIYDPNTKTAVSDSSKIVRYLDATYPSSGPTLLPAELDALQAQGALTRSSCFPSILNPPDHHHYRP